jgi:S1-C subfamily serine protease
MKGMRGLTRSQRGRIQLGDVIFEIDGIPVRNENDYADIMEERKAGDMVSVRTRRDGQIFQYSITLQAPSAR